ncbi:probable beta-1,3-galactosyltransferase 2 isoform X2 [Momordica charantia]|uniref:Probable beta-1,3-galactosyltransferase 2 isoform X2 n=1 Tax=Momordica charantia TaxID=3673 RepID=A0A6J1CHL6_MOMCH|nr:probable beta-1,3-galactosyltransferase 2 isoform X2 [Momordica charantia]
MTLVSLLSHPLLCSHSTYLLCKGVFKSLCRLCTQRPKQKDKETNKPEVEKKKIQGPPLFRFPILSLFILNFPSLTLFCSILFASTDILNGCFLAEVAGCYIKYPEAKMSWKAKGDHYSSRTVLSQKWTLFLCLGSFCSGMLFTNRMCTIPENKGMARTTAAEAEELKSVSEGCNLKTLHQKEVNFSSKDIFGNVFKTHNAIHTLDKTISNLEMELAAAKAVQESIQSSSPLSEDSKQTETSGRRKYLMVVGINTAFSSRKRRDSIRATWMPQGEKRRKLEEEKGIIIRFVIGHSTTSGGILDRAVEAEDKKHGDLLRLDHVEGYLELSAKTKIYFTTAVALWDADFYVKVDDDVHVNIGTLGETLVRHQTKPRVYIGCMKSGPVLSQRGVRYHEPEYWKFGEAGNKYFRHATGQLYAISKDLATYISINQHVLHKYANEDVSLGSWFIGLDVDHIDDRRLCCGTPPDCEWKAQAGNICVASFDWSCSGICRSAERIKEVHRRCGEAENVLWNTTF